MKEQRKLSISILSKLLFQNETYLSLLLRCYPKSLVEKVETQVDVVKSKAWGDQEWEEFFSKIVHQDYTQKATEQWEDDTRRELTERLQAEINGFMEAKKKHTRVLYAQKSKEY